MIHIALYQPEIPHNTGALLRYCACLGLTLDLIHPCGFALSDAHLKRSGLDYIDLATYKNHANFEAFSKQYATRRIIVVDTQGTVPYFDFDFLPDDILLMGQESSGLPWDIVQSADHSVFIPMLAQRRSLNLALASCMVSAEALRQLKGFPAHGTHIKTE